MMSRLHSLSIFVLIGACATHTTSTVPSADSACPPPPPKITQKDVPKLLEIAKDAGFLWKITKNGRVSHLYGTMHLADLSHGLPGPVTREALKSSEAIVLEINPLTIDPMTMVDATQKYAFELSAEDKERVAKLAKEQCLEPKQLADAPAIFQPSALVVAAAHRAGLFSELGSERLLAGMAQSSQRKILELENIESQLGSLFGESVDDAKSQVLFSIGELESHKAVDGIKELFTAWIESDLKKLETYVLESDQKRPESATAKRRLLNDRNVSMAGKIDDLHANNTLFVAIGSAHMVGEAGLPSLLEKRGFQVERVTFAKEEAAAAAK